MSNHVAIGDCTEHCRSWNPAADDPDGEFQYIDLSSIDKDAKRIARITPIACSGAPSRARQLVMAGDVLVSTVRPNLNGVAVVPLELHGATASTGYTVLRPRPNKIDGSYLFHWVKHPMFVDEMVRLATGASYPAISDKIVREAKLPLPSLPEQRRIAAILDKADALRSKRREAIAKLDQLLQAVFLDMFGDPVTNPRGWPVRLLGQLCDVRDGTHDSPKYVADGYPLVTSKNLSGGCVCLDGSMLISEEDFNQINKRSQVHRGDLLMPMIGTVGNPVLVDHDPKYAVKNVAILKFGEATVRNSYVLHLLRSHYFDWVTSQRNRGGTQKFISLGDIRSMPVPLPTSDRQDRFDRFVNALYVRLERAKSAETLGSKLFSGIQTLAFSGEL